MKILITGAYGMLGSDLRDVLSSHDVIAAGSKDLDITDREKVLEFVKENFPDIVINAAAYTAVDDCETNFDEAYQVNAIGPRNLAIACREIDSPLVHISTDYVFDGSKKTPLVEDDPIGPKSAYGKTKLEGEKFIEEILDKYFILRTAWLYGLNGPNFVKTMLALTESYVRLILTIWLWLFQNSLKVINMEFIISQMLENAHGMNIAWNSMHWQERKPK